jgi:hypothetical protein
MLGHRAFVSRKPFTAKQIAASIPGQPFDAKHTCGAATRCGRIVTAPCRAVVA